MERRCERIERASADTVDCNSTDDMSNVAGKNGACSNDVPNESAKTDHTPHTPFMREFTRGQAVSTSKALCWPSGARPFSDMAILLELVRVSAHKMEKGLQRINVRLLLHEWLQSAFRSRPSRSFDLALESFERFDTHQGTLDATSASLACKHLHTTLGVEMQEHCHPFEPGREYPFLGDNSFLSKIIEMKSLPEKSLEKLRDAQEEPCPQLCLYL